MNTGTIIRTILVVATSLNTALMATDLTGFHNPTVDTAYKVVSIILNFIIVAITTYYNNDYTEEATIHTGRMRLMKKQKRGEIDGENFLDHGEEVQGDNI